MRDLLPEEARRRRALARHVLVHFEVHGFELVTPPAFEFAEVLERGLGTLDPADVLRFVEPESGEVAALRPDMTPQIARLVATRLAAEPTPMRLCYEGTVVRRRQGRARRSRQIAQAGVELYGVGSIAGDLEILRLAGSVVRAVGLQDFVIDLGHARIAGELLEALPGPLAGEIARALELKDGARVDDLLASPLAAGVPARVAACIAALPELHSDGSGDASGEALFRKAEALFAGTAAEAPARELHALWLAARAPVEGAPDEQLAPVLRVDFGEVRGFAYYTGPIFHVLADGPGEPIAAGGRYDNLLARFDAPMPAVGFALHLDAVAWARDAAGVRDERAPRVLVAAGPGARGLVRQLREVGVPAVAHEGEGALAYAAAWRFSHVATHEGAAWALHEVGGASADASGSSRIAAARAILEAAAGAGERRR
jgi:ATP phosphoribosyltransferase regulatory subunit